MTRTTALPKYIQISERLIRQVAAGHLRDGSKLPPERELAAELGISVGTLRKSLADMQEKGLLERIQGSGNYVRAHVNDLSVYAFFRLEKPDGGGLPTAQVLSVVRMAKPADAPAFGPSDDAHRIRRLRSLDDALVALEEIWLDGSFAGQITESDLSESLYHFYRQRLGLEITSVEDRIGTATLPDWSPQDFPPAAGTIVGYIQRVSRQSDGDKVEFSRTWFDPDKARYVSRMGKG